VSRRLLGVVLLVVAGVVAVVGTFQPLYLDGIGHGTPTPWAAVTSWEYVFFTMPEGMDFGPVQSPQYAVPIVVAAVLLAVAAALAFLPEAQRLAARYLAIAGTGLLAGAVWAAVTAVMAAVGNMAMQPEGGYTTTVGEGVVMLGASVVVAVVGVVLLHARRPPPRPDGPAVYRVDGVEDDDTDTPPFGIPVAEVEVARLPESSFDDRRADGA